MSMFDESREWWRGAPDVSHGSAAWARAGDVADLLVRSDSAPAAGALILGPAPWGRRRRLVLPRELANCHVAIIGRSGSGKDRGYFFWNLAHYGGSFLYCDPKSEGWEFTSGYQPRAARYAPRDPDNSEGFNPIPLCNGDALLTKRLAFAVVLSSKSDNQFFTDADAMCLAALMAHAATFDTPTLPAMFDFFAGHQGESLVDALRNSPSVLARNNATFFGQGDQKLRGGIIMGIARLLDWLNDERVRRFTSTPHPPDFGRLRRQREGVYWCLPSSDVTVLRPLSALFFTCALDQIKEAKGADDVPVHLFLNEIGNVGRIPDLENDITLLRGEGVGISFGVQSIAQWALVYGREAAEIIRGGCQTKIALRGLELEDATYFSEVLGEYTWTEKKRTKSSKGWLSAPTIIVSEEKRARRLLTPDEVNRIGERQQILKVEGRRPLLTSRYWWRDGFHAKVAAGRCGPVRTIDSMAEGEGSPQPGDGDEEPPSVPEHLREMRERAASTGVK